MKRRRRKPNKACDRVKHVNKFKKTKTETVLVSSSAADAAAAVATPDQKTLVYAPPPSSPLKTGVAIKDPYSQGMCRVIAMMYDFWSGWMNCAFPTCTCGAIHWLDSCFVPTSKRHGLDPSRCTVHALHGLNPIRWCCATRRSDPHLTTCSFDPMQHRELGYMELMERGYLVPPDGHVARRRDLHPRIYLFDLASHPGFACSCDDAIDCPYRHDPNPSLSTVTKYTNPLVRRRVRALCALETLKSEYILHNQYLDML